MKTEFDTAAKEQVINFRQQETTLSSVDMIPGPGEW